MLLPILAVIILFICFIGWGWILTFFFKIEQQPDPGLLAGWGMAFATVLGGIFNLIGMIAPVTVWFFISCGGIFFIIKSYVERKKPLCFVYSIKPNNFSGILSLTLLLFLGGLLLFSLFSAYGHPFNEHDDYHAYLVYPYKMLQSGSLGFEPFSERRLLEYGGLSFLHAILIAGFDLHQPYLMELGLCWLVLITLVLYHGTRSIKSPFFFISVAILCHLVKIPSANISSLVSGTAFFYLLFRSFDFLSKETVVSRVLFLSLTAAGLCSLKSSFIPVCGVTLFLLIMIAQNKKVAFRNRMVELGLIVMTSAIFLLPWMLAMYKSNHTLLYPILGNGYHGSVYSNFPPTICVELNYANAIKGMRHLFYETPFFMSIALLLFSLLKRGRDSVQFRVSLSVFLGGWPLVYALYILSGGIARYNFPLSFGIILFQIVDFFNDEKEPPTNNPLLYNTSFNILLLVLFFNSIYLSYGMRDWNRDWHRARTPQSALDSRYLTHIKKAQYAIPEGEKILARVSTPFLMDFRRNKISTVDWPGGSGPPPGLPCFGDSEKLADYLRRQSFRYIIYSYGDESGHPYKLLASRLNLPNVGYNGRVVKLTEYSFGFQNRLFELAKLYKNLYYDELFVVIDLEELKKVN